ncbi:hypothetical protein KMW28_27945 [Flammeovirga yaeyamensis]|uniref:Uncharacterized protein n=1 Tax=Flammeovirga yaeyamensis TaxID=367791 RepID=A0AAX1NB10_9BACT|nr:MULTISPECIES: hypothetical protein [Flammeovirga]ANQ52429.1 hypothetical protein MY04_5094 [Flammeovirga sp. MY04]MBB3699880.1 hypothetical protein [Flammeovirga yaeyamensis]NMF38323.1 hypothetical protein [Flammeovirga yaeyamensis]QWG04734.1 hypothetical protein KMW28_27945 [Flammeovirga yaeyamensis]
MSKYSKTSQKKLIIYSIVTLFTLTLSLVAEKKFDNKKHDDHIVVVGIMNQNHIKMKYME